MPRPAMIGSTCHNRAADGNPRSPLGTTWRIQPRILAPPLAYGWIAGARLVTYSAVQPPSMARTEPVTNSASSEQR